MYIYKRVQLVQTFRVCCELSWQDESEDERQPTIDEEEEIEEDLVPAMDSVCLDRDLPLRFFGPSDTIVLEFAPPVDAKGTGNDEKQSELEVKTFFGFATLQKFTIDRTLSVCVCLCVCPSQAIPSIVVYPVCCLD